MKLARHSLDDPARLTDLKDQLNLHLAELLADATDAGYSTREVLDALNGLCARQNELLDEDPDPADDPA